jgi:Laminin G domain
MIDLVNETIVDLPAGGFISDGSWHTVHLQADSSNLELSIDGRTVFKENRKNSENLVSVMATRATTQNIFYIGTTEMMNLYSLLVYHGFLHTKFVYLKKKLSNFYNSKHETSKSKILNPCQHKCAQRIRITHFRPPFLLSQVDSQTTRTSRSNQRPITFFRNHFSAVYKAFDSATKPLNGSTNSLNTKVKTLANASCMMNLAIELKYNDRRKNQLHFKQSFRIRI